ncbi:MAG: ABC transporter permease, partial [Burkholderiaceae bacterium]
AAALLLFRRLETAGLKPDSLELIGFSDSHQRIISGVLHRLPDTVALAKKKRFNWLAKLGQISARSCRQFLSHVSYLGLTIAAFATVIRRPRVFRLREFFAQLQQTGISAIPVISLVMFLIGSVMAYLLGLQAEQYGANIYVVDGVALGTVREFSPLLVSTVLAGRSGAAFTAQLGTMKLTEEVDAIRTLGMRPEQVLVLPRICALMLVLPLLVFIGSITALIGAALTCSLMLDITPYTFIDRVHSELSIGHYLIGLIKAPVFALTIGVIGCSMGFTVSRDTRSIGLNTTSTVVQCIVAVVLINAMFAVVFKDIGW